MAAVVCAAAAEAAVLRNPDFEEGSLAGWVTHAGPLAVSVTTNHTFNRNYAGRIHGAFAADQWITNTLGQEIVVTGGDELEVLGFARWQTAAHSAAGATGYVQAVLTGAFGATGKVWTATNAWDFFWLRARLFGVVDNGFESGTLDRWLRGCDDLTPVVQTKVVARGDYALELGGAWTNKWSWNQVYQELALESGDVVQASARMNPVRFEKTAGWAVAGIKLERNDGDCDFESVLEAGGAAAGWTNLVFTAVITNSGTYVYRCMVCGDVVGGAAAATVYFDDVQLWRQGQGEGGTTTARMEVAYIGYSGGGAATSTVDVYVDAISLKGSGHDWQPPTNILTDLRREAEAIATNPAVTIPLLNYPPLNAFGYPGYDTNFVNCPASVEVNFAGWRFKSLKNWTAPLLATNVIEVSELGTNGPGFLEFDQYAYWGVNDGTERCVPAEINTNPPYFTLGVKDGSSAEFGGPFGELEYTYVVGSDLTNFPRRLTTDGSGGWPAKLNIVFTETFSSNVFTNSVWSKHFVLDGVPAGGPAANIKAARIALYATPSPVSNYVAIRSQEIHLGWAGETSCWGMVDYPNLTYQDHNEVGLRAGWLHNLLDVENWYITQSPRGSATIEPIELYGFEAGNWTPRFYEEYLFTWPNAASGVRSIRDDDGVDRLPGPASYHVGFKIGHAGGTNEEGEVQFPEVLNIRGCGYYRMTDYDGVMAGSFRPVAADIFGLYQQMEDAPLIPKAYIRRAPRTTPTNAPDDSYLEAYQLFRSKTNAWWIGTLRTEMHFDYEAALSNGCYIDMETDIWANRALVATQHGALACWSQVSMHWRGSTNINDGTEGHDIDCVMVRRADGEWITHEVLNPPTNICQRTLSRFASNDVVYLMQQDRGRDSYGFATEAPYKRASAFEITMLDDGGRALNLDVYENNTWSEIADNINVTCQLVGDVAEGEHLRYRYRYRALYAPGVRVVQPNETDGGDNWGVNTYRIECQATDGHERPLLADLYYGNGRDDAWRLINTNGPLSVDTNSHRAVYDWDITAIPPGAYYIKATARREEGGKLGFDVSNARLLVGPAQGLPHNAGTNIPGLYWTSAVPVCVTNHNLLRFQAAGGRAAAGAQVWVGDSAGVTNRVVLTNYIDRLVSTARRIDIPWSDFPTVGRTGIVAVGFDVPAPGVGLSVMKMRSLRAPVRISARVTGAPQVDLEGLPLFNPGDVVTNILTIENLTAAAVTGLTIQAVQEYGATTWWWDASPHVPGLWSAHTRQGDRLCGDFEARWTGQILNAGACWVVTNVYVMPYGQRVDHTGRMYEPCDWYFLRNIAGRAQVDVTIRAADGENLYQNEQAAGYTMDDDYDIDNNGLSDRFEIDYSGSYTGLNPQADGDFDGFNNWQEYVAGTRPNDANSRPAVDSCEYAGMADQAAIWLATVTGRVYSVLWSPNLINAQWRLLNTNGLAGNGSLQSIVDHDSPAVTGRYYKIGVRFSDRNWPL